MSNILCRPALIRIVTILRSNNNCDNKIDWIVSQNSLSKGPNIKGDSSTLLTLTELSWLSGPGRSAESPALHAAAHTLWLALPNKTSLECLSGQPFSSPARWGAKPLRSHSVRQRANVNSGEPHKQAAADQLIHDSVGATTLRRSSRGSGLGSCLFHPNWQLESSCFSLPLSQRWKATGRTTAWESCVSLLCS